MGGIIPRWWIGGHLWRYTKIEIEDDVHSGISCVVVVGEMQVNVSVPGGRRWQKEMALA